MINRAGWDASSDKKDNSDVRKGFQEAHSRTAWVSVSGNKEKNWTVRKSALLLGQTSVPFLESIEKGQRDGNKKKYKSYRVRQKYIKLWIRWLIVRKKYKQSEEAMIKGTTFEKFSDLGKMYFIDNNQ